MTLLSVKRWSLVLGVVVSLCAAACNYGVSRSERVAAGSPQPSSIGSVSPSPSVMPSPTPSTSSIPARFRGTVGVIPPALAAKMRGGSWHDGCPVPISGLRLLWVRYWGFDGEVHEGPLVINARVARDMVSVFRRLFVARFPIQTMHLAVPYRGPQDDNPYDKRDYTVGFNCRPVLTAHGEGSGFSQHAYGLAIDVNPMENPYVAGDGFVKNVYARRYKDRSLHRPGMIRPADAVVKAFAAIGWKWGGYWGSAKDYMHFSLTGR